VDLLNPILEKIRPTGFQECKSAVWKDVRQISEDFKQGLQELFFGDDAELRALTIEYGVF